MGIELQTLKKNVDVLNKWFNPINGFKAAAVQEQALKEIIGKIINAEPVSDEDYARLKIFRELKNIRYISNWSKLNGEIGYLLLWVRDFPGYHIDTATKERLQNILGRIEVGTPEELEIQNRSSLDVEDEY